MNLEQIIALIGTLAKLAPVAPAQLVAEMLPIVSRAIARERDRSGLTTRQIADRAGVIIDNATLKVLEDIEKGE